MRPEQDPVVTEKQLEDRKPVFDGLFYQKGQVLISPSLMAAESASAAQEQPTSLPTPADSAK